MLTVISTLSTSTASVAPAPTPVMPIWASWVAASAESVCAATLTAFISTSWVSSFSAAT